MSLEFYGIPNCDTVKKARKWLEARGTDYTFHDYKKEGADAARLEKWVAEAGWEKVLNRAGTTFKKLPPEDTRDLTEAKALDLMVAKPSMIKRPVLVLDSGRDVRILVGFSPDAYAEAFA